MPLSHIHLLRRRIPQGRRGRSMALPPMVSSFVLPAVLLALLLCGPVPPAWSHPDGFVRIVKAGRGKVVHIRTRASGEAAAGEALPGAARPFEGPFPGRGSGSGFIISRDGYIVTNHHVVEGAAVIEVVLDDERKFRAKLVGSDPQTDLALLRIPVRGLPVAAFGDSSKVEVGDWVLAIGNPLGLAHSVTAGIISAKGRNIFADQNLAYGEFLQTDAAINPGNSGGPLFNLAGQVIGVNTAITRRGQGIGFAVPSNLARRVVRQLRRYGQVRRGWLGVAIQELDASTIRRLGLPGATRGLLLRTLSESSPARNAGMRSGDLLTHFRGTPLHRVGRLQKMVAFTPPGTRVRVRLLRREGERGPWKPLRLTVRVGSDPRTADFAADTLLGRMGIHAREVSPGDRRRLGLRGKAGVLVRAVRSGGVGDDIGLMVGDVILELGGRKVAGLKSLEAALAAARDAASLRISMLVRRGRKILYLVIGRADLPR